MLAPSKSIDNAHVVEPCERHGFEDLRAAFAGVSCPPRDCSRSGHSPQRRRHAARPIRPARRQSRRSQAVRSSSSPTRGDPDDGDPDGEPPRRRGELVHISVALTALLEEIGGAR
jgi:hypothetical protein